MPLADVTYNTIQGFGKLGTVTTKAEGVNNFAWAISTTIGIITVVGGIYFIIQIFTGAVAWISSGSDKDGVQKAQKKFTTAVMGLAVLVFAYSLIAIIGTMLGIDILNFSTLIDQIAP